MGRKKKRHKNHSVTQRYKFSVNFYTPLAIFKAELRRRLAQTQVLHRLCRNVVAGIVLNFRN
jgi:hypothetical protein